MSLGENIIFGRFPESDRHKVYKNLFIPKAGDLWTAHRPSKFSPQWHTWKVREVTETSVSLESIDEEEILTWTMPKKGLQSNFSPTHQYLGQIMHDIELWILYVLEDDEGPKYAGRLTEGLMDNWGDNKHLKTI